MHIDTELTLNQINLEFINELEKLEPHGEGNPKPVFYSRVKLVDARKVGKTNAHLKCRFEQNGTIIDGIGFNLGETLGTITKQEIQIVFNVSKNEFRGTITPQIELIEIK